MDEAFNARHSSNLMMFLFFIFWKGKLVKSKMLLLGKESETATRSGYCKASLFFKEKQINTLIFKDQM